MTAIDDTLTALSPDRAIASLLGHLPREARTFLVAADRLRAEWATASEEQRHILWGEASDAADAARIGRSDSLGRILTDVIAERERQDAQWGVEDPGDYERISILTEEVGEVAKAANEANFKSSPTRGDYRHLRAELVQVAATAVAHIQILDRRTPAPSTAPEGDGRG